MSARFVEDVVRAVAVDLTKAAIYVIGGSGLAALALLVWQGGSVPAWTLALAVSVALGAGLAARVGAMRRLRDARFEASIYEAALERHETYSGHIAQSLDALQRIVTGDIHTPISHFIEAGVFGPARDLIADKPAEEIRLSVLLPREDGERWWMPWAAGHTVTGKAKYDQRIVDTLSRHAYESGRPQHWPDVIVDSAFRQNPMASHGTRTLMSFPLRRGDRTFGVFNVVASEPHAFDAAEETYIASLGAVLSVAVGLQMDEQGGAAPDSV